jgi:hypothetical protein
MPTVLQQNAVVYQDDSEGGVEDKSKASINVDDQECNVAEDTKDKIGIIFD